MDAASETDIAELADLVFATAGMLREGFNIAATDLGLTPTQAMALHHLDAPAPMRDLAQLLRCDASNVTGIVDGLERLGVVVRQPDPADRRVKRVVLTQEGVRRRAELRRRSGAEARSVFALPDGDRRRLRDLLAAMHANRAENAQV
ncbi:MarR family winged helix-turn-helix transcriptional regulator [Actinomadura flavalba]|uniref:MarR family winged helix-turn-helix transcriptional regulator n=1 Tax=Actinomadura flavalba TaxID=1120938 RepID=UPI00036E06A4|nr:MarR family transcriptional regulator [Actinomadura flavalba]